MKPKILIHLEGGLVQTVLSDTDLEVIVYDYDTDGIDLSDLKAIPQTTDRRGQTSLAYVFEGEVLEVDPVRVNQLYNKLKYAKLEMPDGFECPVCVRASADLRGMDFTTNEYIYMCNGCHHTIRIHQKEML